MPGTILLLTATACAGANGTARTAAAHESGHRRRAPAVALQPHARLPRAATAGATRPGLAVLTEPLSREVARQAVRRFFQALVAEDWPTLQTLIDPEAQVTADSRGTRWQALTLWRLRLRKLDYTQLSGHIIFQDTAIETYAARDLSVLDESRSFSVALEPQQLLVHVPIETTKVNGSRLLGDKISFVLAPAGPAYTITHMVEPFSLP